MTLIYPALKDYPEDPCAMAAALWDYGNLCALSPNSDFDLAVRMYDRAVNLKGLKPEVGSTLKAIYANNVGVLLFCSGEKEHARRLMQMGSSLPQARPNTELMERLERIECLGRWLYPALFSMAEVTHPFVSSARRVHGLRLNSNGDLERAPEHEHLFWDLYRIYQSIPMVEEEKERAVARKPRLLESEETSPLMHR